MVKDPVCGSILEDSTPRKSTYEGRNYAFCSDACRMKFEQAPERFLAPAGAHDRDSGI